MPIWLALKTFIGRCGGYRLIMDNPSIKEIAKDFDLTEEEVELIIKSMEELILKNIRRSNYDTAYTTRIMGFGTFGTIPEKTIEKMKWKKKYDKVRTKVSRDESKSDKQDARQN